MWSQICIVMEFIPSGLFCAPAEYHKNIINVKNVIALRKINRIVIRIQECLIGRHIYISETPYPFRVNSAAHLLYGIRCIKMMKTVNASITNVGKWKIRCAE